jgi:O-antigen/teichoic acid export membrane protein
MMRVMISWLSFLTRSGLFLFIAPLLTASYNEHEILLWYLCATFNTIIFTLDIGFSPTISRYISYALSKPDAGHQSNLPKISLQEALGASNVIYSVLSIFVFSLIAIAGYFYKTDILEASEHGISLWMVFSIASAIQAYSIRGGAILNGHDKVEEQQLISLFVSIYQISTTIAAYLCSLSFDILFALFYVAPLLQNVLQRLVISKRLKLPNKIASVNKLAYREIFSSSWKSGVGMLASVGLFQVSGLYYVAYYNPTIASSYMFTLQLTRALGTLSQIPLYVYLPRLAKNYASGKLDELNRSFEKKLTISSTLYVVASVFVLLTGQLIFELLGATKIYPSHTLLLIMLTGVYIERFGAALTQFYTVTNDIIWHWVNGSTCALIVVLTLILAPSLVEMAFPFAFTIGNLLIFSWVPLHKSKKHFKITHFKFEIILLAGIAIIAAVGCIRT